MCLYVSMPQKKHSISLWNPSGWPLPAHSPTKDFWDGQALRPDPWRHGKYKLKTHWRLPQRDMIDWHVSGFWPSGSHWDLWFSLPFPPGPWAGRPNTKHGSHVGKPSRNKSKWCTLTSGINLDHLHLNVPHWWDLHSLARMCIPCFFNVVTIYRFPHWFRWSSRSNVGRTRINHPPAITGTRWCSNHSHKWVVFACFTMFYQHYST